MGRAIGPSRASSFLLGWDTHQQDCRPRRRRRPLSARKGLLRILGKEETVREVPTHPTFAEISRFGWRNARTGLAPTPLRPLLLTSAAPGSPFGGRTTSCLPSWARPARRKRRLGSERPTAERYYPLEGDPSVLHRWCAGKSGRRGVPDAFRSFAVQATSQEHSIQEHRPGPASAVTSEDRVHPPSAG